MRATDGRNTNRVPYKTLQTTKTYAHADEIECDAVCKKNTDASTGPTYLHIYLCIEVESD